MVRHRLAPASHVSPPNLSTPRPPAGSFFILSRAHAVALPLPPRRNMSMLRLFTVLVAVLLSVPALADPRVALVVGNSSYEFVPCARHPTNDAKLMADTLQSLGFTLGGGPQFNLDKAAFDKAVQDFAAKLQGAMLVFFYYAGMVCRCAAPTISCRSTPTRHARFSDARCHACAPPDGERRHAA